MKTNPTQRAWELDPFWREAVAVITGGRKLRPEHYLDKLTAEELERLRLALSCSGTYAEQQKLCPARRGGPTDGALPSLSVIAEISQAMRQVNVLRGLEKLTAINAAAKERCQQLGLDPKMTDSVCRIVGEEALNQEAQGIVGDFAINAAQVLLGRESGLTRAELKQRDQQLAREKFLESKKSNQEKALEWCLEEAKSFHEVQDLFKSAFAALKKARGKK